MNEAEYPDYHDEEGSHSQSKSRKHIWFFVLIGVAWLLFEVTNNPAIAAMAMCFKFGTEDFATAIWLYRTDPRRERGKTCAMLYISAGLWQIAFIGLAMILLTFAVLELVEAQGWNKGNGFSVQALLAGASLSILFGLVSSTCTTCLTLIMAYRYRIRLWLSGAVHFSRRNREWPPAYGQKNRIMFLIISTMTICAVVIIPILGVAFSMLTKGVLAADVRVAIMTVGIGVSIFLLLPITVLFLRDLRARGAFADHPADCWSEESDTEMKPASRSLRGRSSRRS